MNLILSYCNRASSWFLLGVVFLLCINSYIAFGITTNQSSNLNKYNQSVQILRKNIQGGFGNSYLAYSELGLVNINSAQSLKVGYQYLVEANYSEYRLDNESKPFDRYYRSLGMAGKFDVKSSKLVKGCSMNCWIISQVDIFQNWNLRNYGQFFCQDNYILLQIIGSKSCQDGYALSLGLMFGEDGYFSKELKTSFKKLGLTHLTAFSGMQTVLILALLEGLLVNMRLSSHLRYFMSIFGMLMIILLVGISPPVLRSILSVLISMSTLKFFGRRISSYRCLIYSGAVMLLVNPLYLANISFQLSFVATLGVILSSIFENKSLKLNQVASNIWSGFLQSGLCIIMTMPIILQLGSSNWLLTLVMNIIFVPILNFLTLFNYVLLIPYIDYLVAPILVLIQGITTQIIIGIGSISPSPNLVFNFSLWDVVLYYAIVTLFCLGFYSLSWLRRKGRD